MINNFTKKELEYFLMVMKPYHWLWQDDPLELENKIQSMIDNYSEDLKSNGTLTLEKQVENYIKADRALFDKFLNRFAQEERALFHKFLNGFTQEELVLLACWSVNRCDQIGIDNAKDEGTIALLHKIQDMIWGWEEK